MKNLPMVSKMVLLALVALFVNACDKEEDLVTYDLKGDWKLISFEDYDASTKITKTEEITWTNFNNGDVTVNFTPSDSTGGIISGIKVTNSFYGHYTIDLKGKITISNVIQTFINEPKWGRLFDSILKAETYEIRNDQLIIFYNQRKNSITFERN